MCGAHFDCSRRIVADAATATAVVIVDDDDNVFDDVSKIEPIRHVTAPGEFDYSEFMVRVRVRDAWCAASEIFANFGKIELNRNSRNKSNDRIGEERKVIFNVCTLLLIY